jgi:hypothetical protein
MGGEGKSIATPLYEKFHTTESHPIPLRQIKVVPQPFKDSQL